MKRAILLHPNEERRTTFQASGLTVLGVRFECDRPKQVKLLSLVVDGVHAKDGPGGIRLDTLGTHLFGRAVQLPEGAVVEVLLKNESDRPVSADLELIEPKLPKALLSKKKRAPRPPWRVGWSDDKRRFYFHAPMQDGGIRMTFSGSRAAVRSSLREHLPLFLDIAKAKSNTPEFIAAIERELGALS